MRIYCANCGDRFSRPEATACCGRTDLCWTCHKEGNHECLEPAKRRLFIVLDIEADPANPEAVPTDEQVAAALAHSTAGEAIADALSNGESYCSVSIHLPDLDELKRLVAELPG